MSVDNMFGMPDEIEEALERNEKLAKELIDTGFNLSSSEANSEESSNPTSKDVPALSDSSSLWESLYYQQKIITEILEKKLKEYNV